MIARAEPRGSLDGFGWVIFWIFGRFVLGGGRFRLMRLVVVRFPLRGMRGMGRWRRFVLSRFTCLRGDWTRRRLGCFALRFSLIR